MKQKKTRKERIKSYVFQGLFILSLLFMIVSVSFSWFTNGKRASVTGIQMNVIEPEEMSITVAGTVLGDQPFNLEFDPNFALKPVNGNGEYFYGLRIEKDENGFLTIHDEMEELINPQMSNYAPAGVFAIDFDVTTSQSATLHLYPEHDQTTAGVFPAPSNANPDTDQPSSVNGSNDVEINTGYICGAVRIALLQMEPDGTFKTKVIWAPDMTTELVKDGNGNITGATAPGSIEPKLIYRGSHSNDILEIPVSNQSGSFTDANSGITYVWGPLTSKVAVGAPTVENEQDDQNQPQADAGNASTTEEQADTTYSSRYRLIIWIDGEDRECDIKMLGGMFGVILHFGL